jgi:hypothetical protein
MVGCSDYVIKNPIRHFNLEDLFEKSVLNRGTSLSQYMTKYALLKKWGYPDEWKLMGVTKLGAPIERWTYYAWIPGFPVSYRYVAKEYRLYFHGDILMKWEDTDLLKRESKDVESKGVKGEVKK